jgi:hypothetical protein
VSQRAGRIVREGALTSTAAMNGNSMGPGTTNHKPMTKKQQMMMQKQQMMKKQQMMAARAWRGRLPPSRHML